MRTVAVSGDHCHRPPEFRTDLLKFVQKFRINDAKPCVFADEFIEREVRPTVGRPCVSGKLKGCQGGVSIARVSSAPDADAAPGV
jgi:hypothetical protein